MRENIEKVLEEREKSFYGLRNCEERSQVNFQKKVDKKLWKKKEEKRRRIIKEEIGGIKNKIKIFENEEKKSREKWENVDLSGEQAEKTYRQRYPHLLKCNFIAFLRYFLVRHQSLFKILF